jgi:hypothetical protein
MSRTTDTEFSEDHRNARTAQRVRPATLHVATVIEEADDFTDLGERAASATPFPDGPSTRTSVGLTAATLAQLPDARTVRSKNDPYDREDMETKTGAEIGARSTRSQFFFDATDRVEMEKAAYPISRYEFRFGVDEELDINSGGFDDEEKDQLHNAGIGPGAHSIRTQQYGWEAPNRPGKWMHTRQKYMHPLWFDDTSNRTVYTGGRRGHAHE